MELVSLLYSETHSFTSLKEGADTENIIKHTSVFLIID